MRKACDLPANMFSVNYLSRNGGTANILASRYCKYDQRNSKFQCRSRRVFAGSLFLPCAHEIRGRHWALEIAMAISLMVEVWKLPLNPSQKLVLLSLSDNANEDTGACWPSVETVSRKTGLGRRTVQRVLRQLEELEYVETVGRFNKSSVYKLTLGASPRRPAGVTMARGGVTMTPLGASPWRPNLNGTIKEPLLEPWVEKLPEQLKAKVKECRKLVREGGLQLMKELLSPGELAKYEQNWRKRVDENPARVYRAFSDLKSNPRKSSIISKAAVANKYWEEDSKLGRYAGLTIEIINAIEAEEELQR